MHKGISRPGIAVIAGDEKFSGFATTPPPPAGTPMEIIGFALGGGGGRFQHID